VQAGSIPSMSLETAGDYFLVHHTAADTVDKIDPQGIARASAAVAVMAYVVADREERLK
jgi:carboxypeptidase Q